MKMRQLRLQTVMQRVREVSYDPRGGCGGSEGVRLADSRAGAEDVVERARMQVGGAVAVSLVGGHGRGWEPFVCGSTAGGEDGGLGVTEGTVGE